MYCGGLLGQLYGGGGGGLTKGTLPAGLVGFAIVRTVSRRI